MRRGPILAGVAALTGALVSACAPGATGPRAVDGAATLERGRLLVESRCAACHATGRMGDSPMSSAPPLREIASRYEPDHLGEAFAEGVVTAHPAMPAFELAPEDIAALTAWLEDLRR